MQNNNEHPKGTFLETWQDCHNAFNAFFDAVFTEFARTFGLLKYAKTKYQKLADNLPKRLPLRHDPNFQDKYKPFEKIIQQRMKEVEHACKKANKAN